MKTRLSFVLFSVIALSAATAFAQTPAATPAGSKPELVVQTGHTDSVSSVAFSPDGRILASGSSDKTVKLWDLATGRELRTLLGHANYVESVAFSPDGRTLASGSADNTVKLWDVATGRELRTLAGHTEAVWSVAFSHEGRVLASGSWDKTVKLWDVATGRLLRTLAGHTDNVRSVAVSPDGHMLASGSRDSTVKLWDIATGKELRTLAGHSDTVVSVAFSPDGHALASASDDHTVKLWDAATGRELRTLVNRSSNTLDGHTFSFSFSVESLAFSPDGHILASGSYDKTVKLWDVATGREIRTVVGHTNTVNSVAFSPDGRTVASGSQDETVKLWDVATGREVLALAGHTSYVNSVAISPNGRTLALASRDVVKVWGVATGRDLSTLAGHTDFISSVAFSPDGRALASASDDNTVKLWDVATGRELRTFASRTDEVIFINSVAFSPRGRLLASASDDKMVKLWNVATGRQLRTLAGHTDDVRSVAFSPDGRILASGSADNTVKLWDVATGRELRTLAGHTHVVESVAFSPDGRTLASGGLTSTVDLWDVATGRELRTLVGHTGFVLSVALSPDGRILASGSGDNTVKLWDVTTGRELRTLTGHTDFISSVAFSPDGRWLVSGSADGSTRLWDVATGKQMARLFALDEKDWAAVDSDGRFDASPGGMELMHWVVGLEPIALDQLKERYYEPGLLAKILGYNKEPLRDVSAFTSVALVPEVETLGSVDENGKLKIKLKNRGGGIGRIQVFVNDKELTADARGPKPDPTAQEATLTVDLAGAPVSRGKPNEIRVVAWNQEGYLSSRGIKTVWTPEGKSEERPPEFYAIVAGVSKYASTDIQLSFPAKDAEDMARALELGGRRLFGAERVHVTVLSTSGNPGVLAPTKANLKRAFEAAQQAKPADVLVVYLAGHGVAVRDSYVYPTQEARSLNDFADPAIREQTGISSEELTEWIKKVPALHQVMILDTCAAGAAAVKLVEKRDVPGDQIRALDRLKDRTGFHVLMGSAADASSYEASQYGQGLLTYSLLQGMRGAALKDDVDVDVSMLFQYAADKVPEFARNIGGIQRPQILAPQGASFDIGQLQPEDRKAIPLEMVKPVLLRPSLMNPEKHRDNLGLTAALRKRLRDEDYASARGEANKFGAVFVDEEEFPGAVTPSGTYRVEGARVVVDMVLTRDDKEVASLQVEGSADDPAALVSKMVDAITQAIGKLAAK